MYTSFREPFRNTFLTLSLMYSGQFKFVAIERTLIVLNLVTRVKVS